jgi:D-erythronate 2-dehydrogenase
LRVAITGGGGFLGSRLARKLLERGELGSRPITRLALLDTAFPSPLEDPRLVAITGDLADTQALARAVMPDTQLVFHLAAVVSGAAEADFDLGMRVNLDGTRSLLELCRRCERAPRLVFASSVAAFGGELADPVDDSTTPTPRSSYGAQKVIGEYLVSEFSRRGYVDGRSLRLPTISVRPGRPNAAASSFASGIIREPLNGQISECPVEPDTGMWLLSPARALEALVHAAELAPGAWGENRVLNLPGITETVAGMLAALRRVAGEEVAARVLFRPDARVQAIVKSWPARFRTPRALEMGFRADPDFETVIRDYIADEGIRPQ